MADSDDETIIRAYIDRMLAVDAADDEPDQAMLESIAAELGLGPDDVQRANTLATDQHRRAQNFVAVRRWDDALAELTQAIALRPLDPDIRYTLAEAYAGRWVATGRSDDRVQAERAIRKVLDKQPDRKEAYALLQRLDQPRSGRRRAVWLGLAAVVCVFGGLVALDDGFLRPDKMLRKALRPRPSAVANRDASPVPPPVTEPAASPTYQPVTEMDIPFVWDASGNGRDLKATVRLSRLTRHRDPSLYNYAVLLTNQGHAIVNKLAVRFAYQSQAGATLKADTVELINSATVPVRPGDEVVTGNLVLVPRDTASIRASVVMRDDLAAPGGFDRSPSVPVTWTVAKPGHVAVEVRKRRESLRAYFAGGKKTYEGHFELLNRGQGAISELEVAADIFDRQEHLLKTVTKSVVYGKGKELAPGHARTFLVFDFFGSPVSDHVRLRITDIQ